MHGGGRSCKAEAEAQLSAVESALKGKEAECAAKAEAAQATLNKEDNTKLVENTKLTGKLTTEAAAAAASAAATSLTKCQELL